MQKLLKITQQTFWQAVFKVVTTSGGFVILGIVSRVYGETGLGSFTLALTYLAFFYILADFGFNGYILSRLQSPGITGQLEFRKLLGVRILWGLVLTIIAALLPFIFTPNLIDFRLAVWVGLGTILLNSLYFCASALIQSKLKYEYSTWPVFLSAPAGVLLIYFLSTAYSPIYFLTSGYVLSWLVYVFFVFILIRKIIKNLTPIFNLSYTKSLFKESSPLAATLILNIVYFRIDSFILSHFQTLSDVGIYNLSYQVFQAVLVLPTYLMNSFYPMMLETLRVNLGRFSSQIKKAALGLLAVSLIISLISYLLSPFIIHLIAGSGFSGSVSALQILTFGFPAYFLSALCMWIMVAKKFRKSLVIIYAIGLIFNLAANLILIPRYSYIAASWITGISEYLILIMQVMVLWFL